MSHPVDFTLLCIFKKWAAAAGQMHSRGDEHSTRGVDGKKEYNNNANFRRKSKLKIAIDNKGRQEKRNALSVENKAFWRLLTPYKPLHQIHKIKIISNPSLPLSLQARILTYESVEGLHHEIITSVYELHILTAHLVDVVQPVSSSGAHILCKTYTEWFLELGIWCWASLAAQHKNKVAKVLTPIFP